MYLFQLTMGDCHFCDMLQLKYQASSQTDSFGSVLATRFRPVLPPEGLCRLRAFLDDLWSRGNGSITSDVSGMDWSVGCLAAIDGYYCLLNTSNVPDRCKGVGLYLYLEYHWMISLRHRRGCSRANCARRCPDGRPADLKTIGPLVPSNGTAFLAAAFALDTLPGNALPNKQPSPSRLF